MPTWWQNSDEIVPQVIAKLGEPRCSSQNWLYDTPKYSIEGALATVKLDDMRNANGLTNKLTRALADICIELHSRPDVKVILFTAAGAYFCTGGAFASTDPEDVNYRFQIPSNATPHERGVQGNLPVALVFYLLNTLPQYKVASIRGENMGAGNSLICTMDYVVAPNTKKTSCNFKEAVRGLASCMSWQGVVSKLGVAQTRALTLISETINADQAKYFGIVDEVINAPTAEVMMRTSDETAKVKAEEVAALSMEEVKKFKRTGPQCKTEIFQCPMGAKGCRAMQANVPDYSDAVKEVIAACGRRGRPGPARLSSSMWPHSSVRLAMEGQHLAVIEICKPEKIDRDMISALLDAAIELHKSIGKVKVVVLKSEGQNLFCGDLDESVAADDQDLHRLLFLLHMLPMYVVGVVAGRAVGHGISLCCVCDRVFALRSAQFQFAKGEAEYVAAKIQKRGGSLEQLGGSTINADAAKEKGIVWEVVDREQEFDGLLSTVCELSTMCANNAVAEAKGYLQTLGGANVNLDMLFAISDHVACRNEDPEFNDAIRAVMDPDHKPHYRKDDSFHVTLRKAAAHSIEEEAPPATRKAVPKTASLSVMI